MKNLLGYKFYRIRHSIRPYIIFCVCCVIALLFTDESYLEDPIVANTPQNLLGVFINEVADAGIAILLIVGCYVISELSNDLKQRCVNYELLSGYSRTKVLCSYYVHIFLLSGSIIAGSLLVGCCKYGLADLGVTLWENRGYFLRTLLFIYMLSFSVISVCIIFAVWFKDTSKATIITFVFLFLSCYIMAAIVATISGDLMANAYEAPPLALLFYTPYLWRWILNPELKVMQLFGAAIVVFIWCGIGLIISNYCFCKMELK